MNAGYPLLILWVPMLLAALPTWTSKPEYTINLRDFGYTEPKDQKARFHVQPKNPVVFTDDNTIAISFFARNSNPGLSTRGKVSGGPYLFKTIFLHANTGVAFRSQEWSNADMGCGLFPVADGSFVVWHNLSFRLFAPTGVLVKRLDLRSVDFPRMPGVSQSPTGNMLFVTRSDTEGNHVLVIRTADLTPVTWLELPGYFSGSGSDMFFAFLRAHADGEYSPPTDVYIVPIADNHSPHPKPRKIFTSGIPGCLSVAFTNQQMLAITGSCHDLIIIDTSGHVHHYQQFGEDMTGPAISCRHCGRILFSTYRLVGGSALLDTFPTAKSRTNVLLDQKTGRVVKWKSPNAKHSVMSFSAISPSGCFIAVEDRSSVNVYNTCGAPDDLDATLRASGPR